ncbi:helix-turn-helix transcriptional regulator [Saccharothrix coeruleofusca]|nr:response regulator transcription factor [Saccharothrix coeruleofusca]MBP2337197.1 DNA-binding NarL/FixJ family response regulator [Saccharothrix coeruleofusca]
MSSHTAWPIDRRHTQGGHARRASVRVSVHATDPLVASGLRAMFQVATGVEPVDEPAEAEVTVAVADAGLRELLPPDIKRLVIIADDLRRVELWTAIRRGLVVLVPRTEAGDQARLARAVHDAHEGRGDLPPEQLGAMLQALKELQENASDPRGLGPNGFTPREVDVIRLLADGFDTGEIAEKLVYSERTVKNVLHNLLSRLNLRNRTHAVAYALRQGVI